MGLLTGAYRLSHGQVAQLVQEIWGIQLCAATVSRAEVWLTAALGLRLVSHGVV